MKNALFIKWDWYAQKLQKSTITVFAFLIFSLGISASSFAICLTNLSPLNTNVGMYNGSTSCLVGNTLCLSESDS